MMTEIEKRLHDYWERRGVNYYVSDVFGRRIVAAHLVKLSPQSLIEVGCGNGELFSTFKDIPRVVGVDWSQPMLDRAAERIQRHEYKNIALYKLDITKTEDVDRFFDEMTFAYRSEKPFKLALTRTVLMHIPEPAVLDACRNLTRLSDNLVIMEYYRPDEDEKLDWHNFHHEYVTIFRDLEYELTASYDRPDGLH